MANLSFFYSTAGDQKTSQMFQTANCYREKGFYPLMLVPETSNNIMRKYMRYDANYFNDQTNLLSIIKSELKIKTFNPLSIVLIDDAHFLNEKQVLQLYSVTDNYNIPINCYGLRTDFMGKSFPGSEKLLCLADKLIEIPSVCLCGKSSIMTIKHSNEGRRIYEGNQIEIDEHANYTSVCRSHFFGGNFLN